MPRKREEEWVPATEAARRIGVTAQALGHWVTKATETRKTVVRLRGGRYEYKWPDFPRWRESELVIAGRSQEEAESRRRKLAAEAEMAEMELAQMRGDVVTVADSVRETNMTLDRLRAKLVNLPGKWAPTMVGCRTIADATAKLDDAIGELMAELSGVTDDFEEAAA
jgi:hypothetical protein